jgi:hypothetical protein
LVLSRLAALVLAALEVAPPQFALAVALSLLAAAEEDFGGSGGRWDPVLLFI